MAHSEHRELIRERLIEVRGTLTQSLAITVRAAQQAGELRSDLHAQDIAAFVFSAWQGAMLRMKADRGPEPLQQFKHVLFTVIKPASTAPRSRNAQLRRLAASAARADMRLRWSRGRPRGAGARCVLVWRRLATMVATHNSA